MRGSPNTVGVSVTVLSGRYLCDQKMGFLKQRATAVAGVVLSAPVAVMSTPAVSEMARVASSRAAVSS